MAGLVGDAEDWARGLDALAGRIGDRQVGVFLGPAPPGPAYSRAWPRPPQESAGLCQVKVELTP